MNLKISENFVCKSRISTDEAIKLYFDASLSELSILADRLRRRLNKNFVYFIENYHIEPTNICLNRCNFCSFYADANSDKAWSKNIDDILFEIENLSFSIKELHIVGAINPNFNVIFYETLFEQIKKIRSDIHIKALTATEIFFLSELHSISIETVLHRLRQKGLDSLPGGGAEILNDQIRINICPTKISSEEWLKVHKIAHKMGIHSNATMLYGHIETIEHRIEHLNKIRKLQDETGMFQAFVPLKFHIHNNQLDNLTPLSIIEDLRIFAISRIFLDNISHIKIYWPAFSKDFASIALNFGADDLDGTIRKSTKIYSMAGAVEHAPSMLINQASEIAKQNGLLLALRDARYKVLQIF